MEGRTNSIVIYLFIFFAVSVFSFSFSDLDFWTNFLAMSAFTQILKDV